MVIRGFVAFLVIFLGVVRVSGQTAGQGSKAAGSAAAGTAAAPVPLPKDPDKLMALAAKTNGLAGLNDRPWHVKFMYQTYDGEGRPGHIGILEEWWESATKYKYVYTGPDYQHTVVRDDDVWKWAGDEAPPPIPVNMVEDYLWTPLPSEKAVSKPYYYVQHRKFGQIELTCMQPGTLAPQLAQDSVTEAANEGQTPWVPTTCFADGSYAARVVIPENGLFVVLNKVVEVDGHSIAEQIGLNDGNLPVATLNVMQLDFPKAIPDAELAAPAGAHTKTEEPPKVPVVKAGVMVGHRISGDAVRYPMFAKTEHISGVVVLSAAIDKDGSVTDLKAVVGPKVLRDEAVRAVKTWKYTPYLLNGKPIEVRTQVNIVFILGG